MSQSLRANLHIDKRVTLEYSKYFLLAKNIAYWKNKRKVLFQKFIVSEKNIMNCGHIEKNPGVLDQCYSNNNFVTNAVLGVRNSNVLLETMLREFNRIAVKRWW